MKAKRLLPVVLLSALSLVAVLLAAAPVVAQEPLLGQIQASTNPADQVGLVGWIPYSEVVIEIDDPDNGVGVDFSITGETDGDGNFGTGFISFEIEAGHVVTVTQGGTVETLIVRDISITDVDAEADIVRGTADPGSEVWVTIEENLAGLWVTADGSGEWMAGFSDVWDITPGTHVNAAQFDEDSDITFTWTDPAPLTLSGFYAPVDKGDIFNSVKGGSTVPLKFEVFDSATSAEQTDVSVVDSFRVKAIACDTQAEIDAIEFVTTGGTSLRYDTAAGQFIQNWKTPKATGCYQVTLTATGGSSLVAYFKVK